MKTLYLRAAIWLCCGIHVLLGGNKILIQCDLSLHSESSSNLFWAKPTGLFAKAGPSDCGGEGESQGGCFLQGIVSVWVSYLQGAAVPHGLFFAPMRDTKARLTTPLFPFLRFSVRMHCVRACTRVCVRVLVQCTHALAACSFCDRWSAAHAQITGPILLKSGLCTLSSSLFISVPNSPNVLAQRQSPYLTALFLKQFEVRILERALLMFNPPQEWWFGADNREMGGITREYVGWKGKWRDDKTIRVTVAKEGRCLSEAAVARGKR